MLSNSYVFLEKILIMSHDKKVFNEFKSIINTNHTYQFENIMYDLFHNDSIKTEDLQILYKVYFFLEKIDNNFIDKNLSQASKNFINALKSLCDFISIDFHPLTLGKKL